MGPERKRHVVIAVRRGYSHIAMWQWATLLVLLLLIWANEILDLPAAYFDMTPRPFDLFRACMSTAAVLVIGIVLVGHTYVQQQQVVRGLVSICSYCKKIRIDQTIWQRIEEFVGEHSNQEFTHGVCPECYDKVVKSIKEKQEKETEAAPRSPDADPAS
ncbi:MAG: hypothetical protein HQ559_17680 [Lentisphaerae bacterium]|nr:hypothetical protein [Lentisphaerota bacterium]